MEQGKKVFKITWEDQEEGSVKRDDLISWKEIVARLANQLQPRKFIFGVPTGGCFVAQELVKIWKGSKLVRFPQLEDLSETYVVDDICDSGKTLQMYAEYGFETHALTRKTTSPKHLAPKALIIDVDTWVKFPWEKEACPEDAVIRLLQYIGEDPKREGLVETPARVIKALAEMTEGYGEDPSTILEKQFEEGSDEMVILSDIEFVSLCEHHMLPFIGKAHVGYIPSDGKVVGISKLARVVECFAKRLQVQERMTSQIAQAINESLLPLGVGVVIEAHHQCMSCRGVKQKNTNMVTSAMLGAMREEPETRAEFLALTMRKK